MIIDQLPALVTAGNNDEIAIEVGTTTYKIKKSDFLKEFMPKSGGEFTGDVTVNGVLDVMNRRCYATLSSAGWYRVLTYSGFNVNSYQLEGFIIHFDITTTFTNNANSAHSVDLQAIYGAIRFVGEQSAGSNIVDKIRYTVNGNYAYVDIHYTGTYNNVVGVKFNVACRQDSEYRFTANSLEAVADSPSGGETVLTEYSFAANVPDASTGYTYMPDGTLIQWGQDGAYASATTKNTEVTFPKSFVDLNYAMNCITRLSGTDYTNYDGITYCIHRESVSKCTVHQKVAVAGPSGTIVREFSWIAIGRWK